MKKNNSYLEFLKTKEKEKKTFGFNPLEMNKNLFEFQKYIVEQNIINGKFGVFADCGLGKTIKELKSKLFYFLF